MSMHSNAQLARKRTNQTERLAVNENDALTRMDRFAVAYCPPSVLGVIPTLFFSLSLPPHRHRYHHVQGNLNADDLRRLPSSLDLGPVSPVDVQRRNNCGNRRSSFPLAELPATIVLLMYGLRK
jgi:hypothetical protein